MSDDPTVPPAGLSGSARVQLSGASRGAPRPRGQAWWPWPFLVPLLAIPAFFIAGFVTSSIRTPPDLCGLPHGPTCQQVDAQIRAVRLATWSSVALALAFWLAACLLRSRRVGMGGRALLVLAGNAALLCACLLWLRVGP